MSDNTLYEDALELRILTAIVAKEARQDIERRLKGYGAEITALQYRVLRQLQEGRYTIKELSLVCMVEPATLVPVADTLERHGFIRRGSDPHDRRRTPLELTESGRECLNRIPFVHDDDVIVKYLRPLPENERRALLQHLRELVMTIHGHDAAVRSITSAVKHHFEFGQQYEQQHIHQPQSPQHADQPSREEPTS